MHLPDSAHTRWPWRVHEITSDFYLHDVWAIRTPGAGPDDFATVLAALAAADDPAKDSAVLRFFLAVREKLGSALGFDKPTSGIGNRVASLRDRLPADMRTAPRGPDSDPLTSVCLLGNEWIREFANKTVHTVMHLSWVPYPAGEFGLQMAVLVKPNGYLGRLYMAAITPFRYLLYPILIRQWERAWLARPGSRSAQTLHAGGGGKDLR